MPKKPLNSESIPGFAEAMELWGEGLELVYDFIISVCELPHLAKKLGIERPFTHSEILEIYKEWLWFLSKLEHPSEIDFFQDFWFPLSNKTYRYYFDLFADEVIVFEHDYFLGFGPIYKEGYWFTNSIIESWEEFEEIQETNDGAEQWLKDLEEEMHELFLDRINYHSDNLLAFDNGPEPITQVSLIKNMAAPIEIRRTKGQLVALNVNSIVIDLLFADFEIIEISALECPDFEKVHEEIEDKSILGTIGELASYLRIIQQSRVTKLIFTFETLEAEIAKVVFEEGLFRIEANDEELLTDLEEAIIAVKEAEFPF